MAGSHILNDEMFGARAAYRPPNRNARRLAVAIALATGALLAATPLVVEAIVSEPVETAPEASVVAFTGPSVEVDGSVMAVRHEGGTLNVSLNASDFGQRVFVQNAAGELLEFIASPGQTNIIAQLPDAFAASGSLTVRVD